MKRSGPIVGGHHFWPHLCYILISLIFSGGGDSRDRRRLWVKEVSACLSQGFAYNKRGKNDASSIAYANSFIL